MYTGLQHLHSYLAYLVLIGLLISWLNGVAGLMGNKVFRPKDRKLSLLGLIPTHLQWVIGLVLYFVSPLGISNFSSAGMKESNARLYFLEHPLMMVLAVVFITIGYAKAKRQVDTAQGFKSIAIFYGLGLVLVLSRLPWSAWLD